MTGAFYFVPNGGYFNGVQVLVSTIGPGNDIAGFARSGNHAIWAQLGGPTAAARQTRGYGFAANMDLCGSRPHA